MKTRRSQVIIKPDFQQKLILYMVLIAMITMNVIIIAAEQLDYLFGSSESLFSMFYLAVAGMEIVAATVIFLLSRDISFRIAGPVYALERTIRGMGEGDLDQILALRTRDQFGEVAGELNKVMQDYRQRIHRAKALAQQLDTAQNSDQSAAMLSELEWFVTEGEASRDS